MATMQPPSPSLVPSELECLAAVHNFLISVLRHVFRTMEAHVGFFSICFVPCLHHCAWLATPDE